MANEIQRYRLNLMPLAFHSRDLQLPRLERLCGRLPGFDGLWV